MEARDERVLQDFLASDEISSYAAFKSHCTSKLPEGLLKEDCGDDGTLIYAIRKKDAPPKMSLCVKVLLNMSLMVWLNGNLLAPSSYAWVCPDGHLRRWSQLDNIWSRYKDAEPSAASSEEKIKQASELLSSCSGFADEMMSRLQFLIEQLKLLTVSPTRKRYSSDTIVTAFTWFMLSACCYKNLRCVLSLPHTSLLRKLSSLVPGVKTSTAGITEYLTNKAKLLKPHERLVCLQIDEIYVQPKMSFKAGHVQGLADNTDSLATTVQVFLISGLLSSLKDVVCMVPVKNLTGELLAGMLRDVLSAAGEAGFKVVCVVADGGMVNRKAYVVLGGDRQFVQFIPTPTFPGEKIFLLFDSVHILKCLRNNWLNLKNFLKTFIFPHLVSGVTTFASFDHFKTLYNMEMSKIIKLAFHLTHKTVSPSNLERQNVKLALNIFYSNNVNALKIVGPSNITQLQNWEGTAYFLQIIIDWWSIVNIHHPNKGKFTRNTFASPFCDVTDFRLAHLESIATWLTKWNTDDTLNNTDGRLSKETFTAWRHTLLSLVSLIKYLLTFHNFSYVLPGKFQTDNLEGRFGAYRRLSGCNYHVAVSQIVESEKRLRLSSLLKFHSARFGETSVQNYLSDFQEALPPCDLLDSTGLIGDMLSSAADMEELPSDEIVTLVYVAGYVATKGVERMNCTNCQTQLTDATKTGELHVQFQSDIETYFTLMDRGGLKYPSATLLLVVQLAYQLFNLTLQSQFESRFVSQPSQKSLFIALNKMYWAEKEIETDARDAVCPRCGRAGESLLVAAIATFSNVLLNNYSKSRTDSEHQKKRKAGGRDALAGTRKAKKVTSK